MIDEIDEMNMNKKLMIVLVLIIVILCSTLWSLILFLAASCLLTCYLFCCRVGESCNTLEI